MKIKLVDSTFSHANAIGLAGENYGDSPAWIEWDTSPGTSDVKVFSDTRLHDVLESDAKKNIGLIVESPAIAIESHKAALELREHFDVIFVHDAELLKYAPFEFYPLGGSWIREWGLFEKTEMVSIIVGSKTQTEGQYLRHEVAQRFPRATPWGAPYTDYIHTKRPMLRPYRYSIIIENGRKDYYFSEKLIDCISQGTVPIYWGCPSIGDFFDLDGVLPFETLGQLSNILKRISERDYASRRSTLQKNLIKARQYRCAEDWIFENYPGVFEL